MSRIQIPIDILTSRLNLSDRFAGVRSQSLGTRFANLKPVSEFLDFKRLSKPANFQEAQSRVNYNLGYFSSNYAAVFLMLSIYSLISNLPLLFVIILVIGGMWAIGKLEGRDLDIGVFRATTSQLYTGLVIIAIPLGFIASPFRSLLWLIGFFRGGGLGSRPRSPKIVPSWGRPPGAKGSRRRRQWEQEQAAWQQHARVEELDSDDTDTQGVGLNFGKKRFASDPLQFTGVDMASGFSARKAHAYDTEESSEDSEADEVDGTNALQVALRDKEEALVQSALARIRRAQEKGKLEVKLNQDELDALEKRRKRMQAVATSKMRKASGSDRGSGNDKRSRSDKQLVTVPISAVDPGSGRKKGKFRRIEEQPHPLAATNPPGMVIAGPNGLAYAPIGYYPPQTSGNRSSPTRPRSATSHQLRGTPPPQVTYQVPGNPRHFSDNTRPTSSSSSSSRRPLPDEADWLPAYPRRSSVSSQHYPVDPFEYQVSSEQPPPIPQQYMHPQTGRRNFSGPAEIAYSSLKRSPPIPASGNSAGRGFDYTPRRQHSGRGGEASAGSSSGEDESDDLGNGVQVFVEEPEPERERAAVSRKAVGGGSSGKKKGKR